MRRPNKFDRSFVVSRSDDASETASSGVNESTYLGTARALNVLSLKGCSRIEKSNDHAAKLDHVEGTSLQARASRLPSVVSDVTSV